MMSYISLYDSVLQCVAALQLYIIRQNDSAVRNTLQHAATYCNTNNAYSIHMMSYIQCVAVCCSVMQCVAVCCSVLQCVAVCCSVLQRIAVCFRVLQCVAVCGSMLQCVTMCCSVLQCVAVCCSVLRCAAVCCSGFAGGLDRAQSSSLCRLTYV